MKFNICSLLIFVSLFAVPSLAQPSLTTEDVVKWRAANPERAQHYVPKTPEAPPSKQSQDQLDAAFLAAETDWNARLTEARRRVREYEQRANQTELEASQSRNVIFHNDASALNANNARIAQLQELARAYRNEKRLAQEAVNRLLDEGRQYGFQLTYISPRLKNGEPNLDYYRSRFLELQTELLVERARADVLQLRTNRVQTIINTNLNTPFYYPTTRRGFIFYPNNGAADAFYLNRLRDELGGVGGDLNATLARIAILTAQLEELQDEGRRAGVPPGIFR
jgi:hypothetical protein